MFYCSILMLATNCGLTLFSDCFAKPQIPALHIKCRDCRWFAGVKAAACHFLFAFAQGILYTTPFCVSDPCSHAFSHHDWCTHCIFMIE